MSSSVAEQYSSIRAIRPVVESKSLRAFMKSAEKLVADWDFGQSNGYEVDPLVFAARNLHITLFKRRALTTPRVNDAMRKIEDYLQNDYHYFTRTRQSRPGVRPTRVVDRRENPLPAALEEQERDYIPEGQHPLLWASKIIISSADESGHPGSELALQLSDGPVVQLLDMQSGLINDAADRINASKLLPRQPIKENPTELPFMRAPFRSEANRLEFIDMLSEELPVYDIGLGPIEYLHRLPMPQSAA